VLEDTTHSTGSEISRTWLFVAPAKKSMLKSNKSFLPDHVDQSIMLLDLGAYKAPKPF
jgi:hypothetical protein